MITLDDVARQAGVSKAAVSRTLNHDPNLVITEATRERIMRAAGELGYQSKHSKRMEKVRRIAVIHKETHYKSRADNAFYFAIRYGIESACHDERIAYTFLPNTMLRDFPSDLDGVILNGNYGKEQIEAMRPYLSDLPVAAVGWINHLEDESDTITFDVERTVETAMDYLCEQGCRNFAYIGGRDMNGVPPHRKKICCYRNYIKTHPELISVGETEGEYGSESGYNLACAWLSENRTMPDAFFVSHDPIAVGVIRALNERGVPVPDRVCVIGVNGDEIGTIASPSLTTVDVYAEEMGRETVRALSERMEGRRSVPKKTMLYPRLIVRQSA